MIADSSVLILFARARRLDLLQATAGPIQLTAAVRNESIEAATDRPDSRDLGAELEAGRFTLVAVSRRRVAAVRRRYPNLGRGEASVLAAALEHGESAVLLDELAARRAAVLEGLAPVGTLGVLARAHRPGVLKDNRDAAAALRNLLAAGLWIAPEVGESFWEALGGRA